jgi:hypothetical protein
MGQQRAQKAAEEAYYRAKRQRGRSKDILEQGIDPSYIEDIDLSYLNALRQILPEDAAYTPEEYQYLEAPDPIDYQYVGDVDPTQISDSPEMRRAQLAALSDLQRRAEEGLDAESEADFMRARTRAGEMARGREGAIMQNMQARGMGGSGIEAVLRQVASQQQAGNLAQMGADQAAENARQRALAEEARLAAAGDIRGQDVSLNQANANILNQFATMNSRNRQKLLNMNTQQQNKALRRGVEEQRNVQKRNVDKRNEGQLKNLDLSMLKNQSWNENVLRQGETRAQKNRDLFNAYKNKAHAMSGAELGYIPDIQARGAAQAAAERGMWGAAGSGITNIYDMYQKERMLDKMGQQKGGGGQNGQ